MLSVKIYPDKFQSESFFLPGNKPITDMRLSFYIKPEEFENETQQTLPEKKNIQFSWRQFFSSTLFKMFSGPHRLNLKTGTFKFIPFYERFRKVSLGGAEKGYQSVLTSLNFIWILLKLSSEQTDLATLFPSKGSVKK